MLKRSVLSLLLALPYGIQTVAQSGSRPAPRTPPASAQATKFNGHPGVEKGSYRVVVDAVQKKADNYHVTFIFENLTDKSITVKWMHNRMFDREHEKDPYLIDEKKNKYRIQAEQWEGVLTNQISGGAEILAGTSLKLTYLFYGPGDGTTFDLVAIDATDGLPLVIKGLKVTANEDANASSPRPAFVTESYRVVVESVSRDADNLTITLVFESLADQPFKMSWGDGYYEDSIWKSSEPYLIDEQADRYYLRGQDSAKVIGSAYSWEEAPDLLPGTKLKTQLVFRVTGNGTVFTLACKERSPKGSRPIVIKGLKAE